MSQKLSFYTTFITLITSLPFMGSTLAEPILESWYTDSSRAYARIYSSSQDVSTQNASTTWSRGAGVQSQPAYAGIYGVSYDDNSVYITASGLGAHIMGPWSTGFPNFPQNRGTIYSIPKTPEIPALKTNTADGAIGLFVDGVSMFDSRDAFSWDDDSQTNQPTNGNGDGIWNGDAYVNESHTFDPAFAHQAGNHYHYHANPPALRHLLGDRVTYDAHTHVYSEEANATSHSPILAWVRDGLPLYGPYGYRDPLDASSGIERMRSGFRLRSVTDRTTLPAWAARAQNKSTALSGAEHGPSLSQVPLGHYLEDNEYLGDVGFILGVDFDLNEYNCRWCVTPEFPNGTWAYFVNIQADGTPVFPYNIGRQYFGSPNGGTVTTIPNGSTLVFEGGPNAAPKDMQVSELNPESGDITLSWSGTEGASYEISQSEDLHQWLPMRETQQTSFTDKGTIQAQTRSFYRTRVIDVAPYDTTGLTGALQPREGLTAFLVTLEGNSLPSDLTILPNRVLFEGDAVLALSRPSINEIILQAPTEFLAAGEYDIHVVFPPNATSSSTVSTGAYMKLPASNILLVIVDDWGIDSSPLDNPGAANLPIMPNLANLAAQGIRFTQAYAHAACSTTRASILTGRYPYRTGIGSPGGANLPVEEVTIADALSKHSSYGLGALGKWHLGGGNDGPATAGGWPHFLGSLSSAVDDYYAWQRYDTSGAAITVDRTTFANPYATTVTTDDALNFIQSQGSNPWLCWVGYNAPHGPFHDPPTMINGVPNPIAPGGGRRSQYEAALWAFDTELGRLLENINLTETTVILIGDNGTPANQIQPPYTSDHAKTTIYEGGTRVPLIIAGAAVTQPGVSNALVHCSDLFPTMLELAGVSPNQLNVELDGVSVLPILTNSDVAERISAVESFGNSITSPGRAIRLGEYKLIIRDDPTDPTDTASFEFYHIPSDINETNNLLADPVNTSLTASQQAAFEQILLRNTELGGPYNSDEEVNLITIFANLDPNAFSPMVPNLTNPSGRTVKPSSVTVGGVSANFVSREDSNGNPDAFSMRLTIDPGLLPAGSHSIVVTFNGNPDPRVFTATNLYTAP